MARSSHEESMAARQPGAIPAPPFQVISNPFLYVGVEFDRTAVADLVPSELQIASQPRGVMGFYLAPTGWVMAPFSAFYAAIEVANHPSIDGSPAVFVAEGYFSGRAGEVQRAIYNRAVVDGWCAIERDGDIITASAGPGTQQALRIVVRLQSGVGEPYSGIHDYMALNTGGQLHVYSVAYTGGNAPCDVLAFQIAGNAPDRLKALTPRNVAWAWYIPHMPLTFGTPRHLNAGRRRAEADEAQVGLLDALSRVSRPAVAVSADFDIVYANDAAEQLLGFPDGETLNLRQVLGGNDRSLARLAKEASQLEPGAFSEPMTITSKGDQIIVRALAVGSRGGNATTMLVFNAPSARGAASPLAMLQLLGLTPAEARVASLVGDGSAPKDAAARLGVTEHTVRSTLKVVFDKLGVTRQAELARIVARLE